MNHLLDDEDDFAGQANHRELTLSTTAILGIFFGLVLVCGLFFAFGYNMGRKVSSPALAAASDAPATGASSTNFNAFKPAAGSPVASGGPTPAAMPPPSNVASSSGSAAISTTASTASPRAAAAPEQDDDSPPARAPATTQPAAPVPVQARPVATAPAAAAEAAPGNFIVQVAAVSHQEDADLLVGALKSKGYAVAARSEPQDRLVHIQVGPFTNRKDADAMRQKLLNDGYNAIVK